MSKFNRFTPAGTSADEGLIMAELDELGDEPNFNLFGSSGLDFFSEDELLLTETDLTEQKETTEQTEIGQLNDEDIDNFITENRNFFFVVE